MAVYSVAAAGSQASSSAVFRSPGMFLTQPIRKPGHEGQDVGLEVFRARVGEMYGISCASLWQLYQSLETLRTSDCTSPCVMQGSRLLARSLGLVAGSCWSKDWYETSRWYSGPKHLHWPSLFLTRCSFGFELVEYRLSPGNDIRRSTPELTISSTVSALFLSFLSIA